ncbi:metastasis-associated protein MTA3 [Lepeophtheirus salmonis]|uniref:metastasis-associated protein MTA3 n=1 Tax=Lepeophtheirus salmonis TaxID=72036 RepID=UPI001AEA42CE|nr:metastasis-associated protein MTA3-like [Lepeophtheirus salmonis]
MNASGHSPPGQSSSWNMYRVGDYVYFENSASNCYAIRRIEELNKGGNGNVEARVMCFYRRSEIPSSLLPQADKHHWGDEDDFEDEEDEEEEEQQEDGSRRRRRLTRAWLKEREVFLSRQVETLPATLIRGKCSVTLLSEVETLESYACREDAFFYALVYDPVHKTLLADRGEIRIGSAYQATVPPLLASGESDERDEALLEERLWNTDHRIAEEQVDKFLIISRSVGTFARALDCSSSVKQPSLHMSAAAASRDITLFHAHHLLHKHEYDIASALGALVPTTGPMLCRDEMEDWSASEANLFEEAVEKYGKDFNDIRRDFLPWKSMKNIIEFFFMWKTTDRYVQQKRLKAIEAESKLKQVYVPPYNNKSTRLTGSNGELFIRGKDCDAYPNLSKYSWIKYKKYGIFVSSSTIEDSFILDKSTFSSSTAAKLAQLRPGLIIEPGSPAGGTNKSGSGKTRAAFYLKTTPLTRASRRICRGMINIHHFARKPGTPIDMKGVKADAISKMSGMSEKKIRLYNKFTQKKRVDMSVVVQRLGQKDIGRQEWLILTPRSQLPRPVRESFPRPNKRSDGSYIYDRVPSSYQSTPNHNAILYKKRAYDERGPEGPASKVLRPDGRQHIPNVVPPKGRVATLTRIQGGHKQVISWMDAPDDVFYKATITTKKLRKRLPVVQLRRAARKPFKKVISFPA